MAVKGGTFTSVVTWQTQTWSIRRFEWEGITLVERWTADSDWDPVPPGGVFFEPVFHAALANGFRLHAGGRGHAARGRSPGRAIRPAPGSFRRSARSPTSTSPVRSPRMKPAISTTTPLRLDAGNPWTNDRLGAWLVKITPAGDAPRVSYDAWSPMLPPRTRSALASFLTNDLPWPPSPNAVPAR